MLFYCLFQYFKEKEYQTESKQNETFGSVICWKNIIRETWSSHQKILEEATRVGGAPPCLVGPSSTSRPTSFAYIVPRTLKTSTEKIDREFRRASLCSHQKPLESPFRHPAGGGNPSPVAIFIIPVLSMTRRE